MGSPRLHHLKSFLANFSYFGFPLKNRIRCKWVTVPLWSAYLLADWAANFSIAIISQSQPKPSTGDSHKNARIAVQNGDLLAFWASFLLVHLGGPDTITAFSLEDNELWIRHLFGLVVQCIAAVYVFVQSLPRNRLWIPTMLMFMTGIIKYAERTRSLYLASVDKFTASIHTEVDPGPNYAKLMVEYQSKKEAKLPTRIELVQEPADRAAKSANKAKKGRLTELEVVQYGYQFFSEFKGLLVDSYYSRAEQNKNRDFFLKRTAGDAFKVVEVELNFIYYALFTKFPVVFGKTGAIVRFFSISTVCSAIALFTFKNKSNFTATDVSITYGLLFGALVQDMTALIMLLFSDWSTISLSESPDDDIELEKSFKTRFFNLLLILRTEAADTLEAGCMKRLVRLLFQRRWSESVSTYNLINYCCYDPHPMLKGYIFDKLPFGGDFYDSFVYVHSEEFTPSLRNFIFEELKSKAELADDLETVKEISSAKGDWVLRVEEGWSSLLKYVLNLDYDKSLILWHIATELCYNEELYDEYTAQRKISKLLSDYMLYLLIMQPRLMSVAGIGKVRFWDTCAEARRFFAERDVKELSPLEELTEGVWDKDIDLVQVKACREILKVPTEGVLPSTIKGVQSKSVLFDGCILAKELIQIAEDKKLDKWLIISKVWVELLCYGARHSRVNVHAQQVGNGGELITIVWLLMAHFGLGEEFHGNQGPPRAKLIVGK